MANFLPAEVRIVDLNQATTLTGAELVECVQTTAGTCNSFAVGLNQLLTTLLPTGTAAMPGPYQTGNLSPLGGVLFGQGTSVIGITAQGATGFPLVAGGSSNRPSFSSLPISAITSIGPGTVLSNPTTANATPVATTNVNIGSSLVVGGLQTTPLGTSIVAAFGLAGGSGFVQIGQLPNNSIYGSLWFAAGTATGSNWSIIQDATLGDNTLYLNAPTATGIVAFQVNTVPTNIAVVNATGLGSIGSINVGNMSAIPSTGSTSLGIKFSTVANFGIFYGSGAPALNAATGSLYIRSDGSNATTRLYVNTVGTAVWTAIPSGG